MIYEIVSISYTRGLNVRSDIGFLGYLLTLYQLPLEPIWRRVGTNLLE
jgi:hypothetical protein